MLLTSPDPLERERRQGSVAISLVFERKRAQTVRGREAITAIVLVSTNGITLIIVS